MPLAVASKLRDAADTRPESRNCDDAHQFSLLAGTSMMRVVPTTGVTDPADAAAIWAIIEPMIRAGETYTLDRDMGEGDALAYWFGPDKETFVAEDEGTILGTYYLRANQAAARPFFQL